MSSIWSSVEDLDTIPTTTTTTTTTTTVEDTTTTFGGWCLFKERIFNSYNNNKQQQQTNKQNPRQQTRTTRTNIIMMWCCSSSLLSFVSAPLLLLLVLQVVIDFQARSTLAFTASPTLHHQLTTTTTTTVVSSRTTTTRTRRLSSLSSSSFLHRPVVQKQQRLKEQQQPGHQQQQQSLMAAASLVLYSSTAQEQEATKQQSNAESDETTTTTTTPTVTTAGDATTKKDGEEMKKAMSSIGFSTDTENAKMPYVYFKRAFYRLVTAESKKAADAASGSTSGSSSSWSSTSSSSSNSLIDKIVIEERVRYLWNSSDTSTFDDSIAMPVGLRTLIVRYRDGGIGGTNAKIATTTGCNPNDSIIGRELFGLNIQIETDLDDPITVAWNDVQESTGMRKLDIREHYDSIRKAMSKQDYQYIKRKAKYPGGKHNGLDGNNHYNIEMTIATALFLITNPTSVTNSFYTNNVLELSCNMGLAGLLGAFGTKTLQDIQTGRFNNNKSKGPKDGVTTDEGEERDGLPVDLKRIVLTDVFPDSLYATFYNALYSGMISSSWLSPAATAASKKDDNKDDTAAEEDADAANNTKRFMLKKFNWSRRRWVRGTNGYYVREEIQPVSEYHTIIANDYTTLYGEGSKMMFELAKQVAYRLAPSTTSTSSTTTSSSSSTPTFVHICPYQRNVKLLTKTLEQGYKMKVDNQPMAMERIIPNIPQYITNDENGIERHLDEQVVRLVGGGGNTNNNNDDDDDDNNYQIFGLQYITAQHDRNYKGTTYQDGLNFFPIETGEYDDPDIGSS